MLADETNVPLCLKGWLGLTAGWPGLGGGVQDTVTVVPADMRAWEAPEQADILVRCEGAGCEAPGTALAVHAALVTCAGVLPLPTRCVSAAVAATFALLLLPLPPGAPINHGVLTVVLLFLLLGAVAGWACSELLGSFGDNELSPECLDGAQRFLKEGGISIPQVC